jgi:putative DNA primase/helicase
MTRDLAERCKNRWPDIFRQLGILSSAALAGKDVPCPICGGTDRFRFSDKGFGRWFCRGCGHGGDGVRLIQAIKRVDFAEAATIVEGVVGKVSPAADAGNCKLRDPMRSWHNAAPFTRGSAADLYLRGRKLTLTEVEARSLRHHCELWHWPSERKLPALLARVALATDEDLTTHQTFLTPDGRKAPLGDKARLFVAGGRTASGGVWFGVADATSEFMVAEGIESTLSAMRIFNCESGCAALSANGIRKLILPKEARRVRIFADHDALGQGLTAAREAARRWIAEGRTVAVSIADAVGEDANDVWLMRRCLGAPSNILLSSSRMFPPRKCGRQRSPHA